VYISHEVPYAKGQSGWNYSLAQGHFVNKWGDVAQTGKIQRTLEEEQYQYNLGPSVPEKFLRGLLATTLTGVAVKLVL
jgi:hypothetical protein